MLPRLWARSWTQPQRRISKSKKVSNYILLFEIFARALNPCSNIDWLSKERSDQVVVGLEECIPLSVHWYKVPRPRRFPEILGYRLAYFFYLAKLNLTQDGRQNHFTCFHIAASRIWPFPINYPYWRGNSFLAPVSQYTYPCEIPRLSLFKPV